MPVPQEQADLIALTSQIVSAHVSHNSVNPDQLPKLIKSVYDALGSASAPEPVATEPAVPVKTSVKPGAIICLECGAPFKMLKRHLGTEHNLTVEDYRRRYNLPTAYPLVAPDYAKVRSTLAKKIGLGRVRGDRQGGRRKAIAKRRSV